MVAVAVVPCWLNVRVYDRGEIGPVARTDVQSITRSQYGWGLGGLLVSNDQSKGQLSHDRAAVKNRCAVQPQCLIFLLHT